MSGTMHQGLVQKENGVPNFIQLGWSKRFEEFEKTLTTANRRVIFDQDEKKKNEETLRKQKEENEKRNEEIKKNVHDSYAINFLRRFSFCELNEKMKKNDYVSLHDDNSIVSKTQSTEMWFPRKGLHPGIAIFGKSEIEDNMALQDTSFKTNDDETKYLKGMTSYERCNAVANKLNRFMSLDFIGPYPTTIPNFFRCSSHKHTDVSYLDFVRTFESMHKLDPDIA
jgi:hypothetical protein